MVKPAKDGPTEPSSGGRSQRGIHRRRKGKKPGANSGVLKALRQLSESWKKPGASKEGDTTADKGAAMDPAASLEQFLHTGRTGRRNAVPDLGDEKVAGLSTADLPGDMAALSCSDKDKKDSKAEEAKS